MVASNRERAKYTTSTVKQTIARLDGIVDCIGTCIIIDFPEPINDIKMLSPAAVVNGLTQTPQ